jgi:hypothetical protein
MFGPETFVKFVILCAVCFCVYVSCVSGSVFMIHNLCLAFTFAAPANKLLSPTEIT